MRETLFQSHEFAEFHEKKKILKFVKTVTAFNNLQCSDILWGYAGFFRTNTKFIILISLQPAIPSETTDSERNFHGMCS